jgi:peptidase YpeB-like protein
MLLITGAAVLAAGAGGAGIAQGLGGDSEEWVRGPAADRAKQAALQSVGGGRVVGVEREDEGTTGWEVEVLRGDGRQIEVHLGSDLQRAGVEADDDEDDDGFEDERGDDDEREGDDDD